MNSMNTTQDIKAFFSYPRQDVVAGIVVFLVALPLCLGIAIASGVPPITGIVAGIVGGIIVPLVSRSPLSVSGPAAGLISIVLMEIDRLGSIERFLSAVILAGAIQFLFGVCRTGKYAALVPSSVIKGMLAAIGITIIIKQLPVALGVTGGLGDISAGFAMGPTIITVISLIILYGWKRTPLAKFALLSPALVLVVLSSLLALMFRNAPSLALTPDQFVDVPLGGFSALASALPRPEFGAFMDKDVWIVAVTIAIVASIETLLSLQAIDRLDPLQRHSPPNRELLAQGIANALSGFLGGLPVTSVIVRSGANVSAGGRERLSAFVHGLLLLFAVVFAGTVLNLIPLACLAAVLIQVGLNLAKPSLFRMQAKLGAMQFLPFAITIAAVLGLDLLKGVIVGTILGVIFVLHQNSKSVIVTTRGENGVVQMKFRRDGTFLSKPKISAALESIEDDSTLEIVATGEFLDHDVRELLTTFISGASARRITVRLVGVDLAGATVGGGH
jgi:MFS superfamily sulfate permease-like transporter